MYIVPGVEECGSKYNRVDIVGLTKRKLKILILNFEKIEDFRQKNAHFAKLNFFEMKPVQSSSRVCACMGVLFFQGFLPVQGLYCQTYPIQGLFVKQLTAGQNLGIKSTGCRKDAELALKEADLLVIGQRVATAGCKIRLASG